MRSMLVCALTLPLAAGLAGCNDSGQYKTAQEAKQQRSAAGHDDHDHDHGAKGPNGGAIVELGEHEHHAEVVLDHDAHALRVFLTGKDMKTPSLSKAQAVTITPEEGAALTLKPAPLQGETDGASRFELVDEKITHDLMDAGFIHGDLSVEIGEKTYKGHVDAHFEGEHVHKDEPAAAPTPGN